MKSSSRISSIVLQAILFAKIQAVFTSDDFSFQVPLSQQSNNPAENFNNLTLTTATSQSKTSRESEVAPKKISPLQLRELKYFYDKIEVIPVGPTKDNPSIGGFVSQKCYADPSQKDSEKYCIFVNPTFSNNRGMVLFIRRSFLEKNLGEWTIFDEKKVMQDEERAAFPYELIYMPEKGGLGSFATKKLQLGDRVMKDHSLVQVFASSMNWERDDWKALLKDMVDYLPIKGRELFARQHGVGETELDWISSAFDRNVFAASLDDQENGGFSFLPEPAYLNHDCRPNVAYYFDDTTLSLEMFAVRDIAPGEELFDSYRQLDLSWEARQDTLFHHYGFKCKCSQCNLPPWGITVSDDRLDQIHNLSSLLSNWTARPPPTPAMADHLIQLYQLEHMEAAIDTAYSLASLAYNSVGDTVKASMYATLAIAYGIYINGPDWYSYEAHLLLEKDPKSHWSYRSRLSDGSASQKKDEKIAADKENAAMKLSIVSDDGRCK